MAEVINFTKGQLLNPATLETIKKEMADIVLYIDADRAMSLAQSLEETLGIRLTDKYSPSLEQEYYKIVAILKFLSLPVLSEAEVKQLFQYCLGEALNVENLDIKQRLESWFIIYPWDYRDLLKKELQKVISSNNEVLTAKKIIISNNELTGTVANWIKDFIVSAGAEQVENIKKIQYFSNSRNLNSQSVIDKNKVIELVNLYNYLKISALTPEGTDKYITFIDKDGVIKSLENGRITNLNLPVLKVTPKQNKEMAYRIQATGAKTVNPIDSLTLKYRVYRDQRHRFLEAEDEVNTKTKGDLELIKRELSTAVRQGEKFGTAACLFILANQQALITALRDNPSWFASTAEYIQKKYAPAYSQDQIKFAVSNLKLEPATPAALSEFLQYILRDKMKMSENDSALVGAEIGQILGGHYQSLAYGNPDTGNFEWIKNKIVDGKLVSEID